MHLCLCLHAHLNFSVNKFHRCFQMGKLHTFLPCWFYLKGLWLLLLQCLWTMITSLRLLLCIYSIVPKNYSFKLRSTECFFNKSKSFNFYIDREDANTGGIGQKKNTKQAGEKTQQVISSNFLAPAMIHTCLRLLCVGADGKAS